MIMPGLVTQHAGPPEARLEFALYRCATPNQEERPVTVKHPSVEELACIAQAYHLSQLRYAGFSWKAANGNMGWQRDRNPTSPSGKNGIVAG